MTQLAVAEIADLPVGTVVRETCHGQLRETDPETTTADYERRDDGWYIIHLSNPEFDITPDEYGPFSSEDVFVDQHPYYPLAPFTYTYEIVASSAGSEEAA